MPAVTWFLSFLLAFAGTMIPAIVLHVERKLLPWAGLCGGLGYLVSVMATPGAGIPGYLQVFLAEVEGLFSEIVARRFKTPAITFCIPAIFPLVPGIGAYQTMQLTVAVEWQKAAASGVHAAATFSIAFGLMWSPPFSGVGPFARGGSLRHRYTVLNGSPEASATRRTSSYSGASFRTSCQEDRFTAIGSPATCTVTMSLSITVRFIVARRMPMVLLSRKMSASSVRTQSAVVMTDRSMPGRFFFI